MVAAINPPGPIHETEREYREKSKQYLTSHQLADFRKCPALYFKKKQGLIPDEDRPAYVLGRAAHTLILEGRDTFDASYAFGGPINPKTGTYFGSATKAYAEWAVAQGKPTLTDEQLGLVVHLANAVRSHDGASRLLGAKGVAEGVVRTDYCGVASQIRMDWYAPEIGFVDLKTCDDLTWFEADARRFGYAYQMAFYRSVFEQAMQITLPVHVIAVEKREPFRCGVWSLSEQTLLSCQRENEAAIERLKHCQASDVWTTGYEESRVFELV